MQCLSNLSIILTSGDARPNGPENNMLKIAQLRNALDAAEQALDAAYVADAPHAEIKKLEKAEAAARAAYHAEFNAALQLKAKYEAMGDETNIGADNAGDTFLHAEHGNARFNSTEYWQCAIDSAQLMMDEAARQAKRDAEFAAWRAEEAA